MLFCPLSYWRYDTGHAVISLRNGTTITASDLGTLPRHWQPTYMNSSISQAEGYQLAELVRLCELFDLPAGLIIILPNGRLGLRGY